MSAVVQYVRKNWKMFAVGGAAVAVLLWIWKFRKSLFFRKRSTSTSTSSSTSSSLTPNSKSSFAVISDPNLQTRFVAASEKVRGGDPKLQAIQRDEQMQLRVYGLFKQASEGPAPENSANFWDYVAKAKWQAWNGLRTLSREEAMQQYVQLIEDVSGEKIIAPANGEVSTPSPKQAPQWKSQSKMQDPLGSFAVQNGSPSETNAQRKDFLFYCQEGNTVQALLQVNADSSVLDSRDEQGLTGLLWACDRGDVALVSQLLDVGADIQQQDSQGQTPLHYACVCGHVDLARLLLERGADPKAKVKTAICCVVSLPLNFSFSLKDNQGLTPLDTADDPDIEVLFPKPEK